MRLIYLIYVILLFCALGCVEKKPEPPPPTPPRIACTLDESTKKVSIDLVFFSENDNFHTSIRLDSMDKINNYKKELQFALNQVEEAEKRMLYHEESITSKDATSIVPPNTSPTVQPQ